MLQGFRKRHKQVDIIADGVILEVTDLANAAARVTFHRNEAAKGTARVESSPYHKHNRRAR